MMGNRR